MSTYKVHLHNGEVFIYECNKELTELLLELNTCSDGYMQFGDHIRQKHAVIGIDYVQSATTEGTEGDA